MAFKRIWIEDGCISCNLCEDLCPEVFEVPAGGECAVRKDAGPHLVDPDMDESIREASDSCPVEVIQFEED